MNRIQVNTIAQRAFRIGIALAIIAFLFRLMHWPSRYILNLISELGLVVSFFFLYATTAEKTVFNHISLGACVIILLNLMYPFLGIGFSPFLKYKSLAIFGLIVPEISSLFSNRRNNSGLNENLEEYEFGREEEIIDADSSPVKNKYKASMVLLGIGALPMFVGFLFKIQHYPGASALLTFGFGISAIGVFLLFIKK